MSALSNTIPTSDADRENLLSLLRESRERFLASFSDVAEENCRFRPAEGCWSVLDCLEHIAVAETTMVGLLNAPRRPRAADSPNRERIFLERMGRRDRKAEAPEGGRPTGRFATLADARKQFETARAGAIRFTQENKEDLRATEVTHPHPLVGNVSAYEMVIILAKHAERHALQIEEIKNSPAFLATKGRG